MKNWCEKDKKYIWHPFTQHATERDPVVITSARGACLYDEQGHEILDMISSWWTCVHGHAHPAINEALRDQAARMEHVMFAGFSHPPAIDLAEMLAQILPGDLNHTFFSDNGSTAVEVALKLSYQYWKNKGEDGRTKFLAFEGAYHGDTIGAMSAGKSCGFFNVWQDLLFCVDTVPYPHTWDGDNDIQAKEDRALEIFKKHLQAHRNETAALIVEPLMQGAAGIRFCRPAFMKRVTDLARDAGLLIVYDEVAVGFGRSGEMFACEKIGVTPDIICLSKALTAGYMPLSVTVARDHVYESFLDNDFKKAFAHGHTFTANPLACAVALKSLDLFDTEKTMERVAHLEARHRAQLPALQALPDIYMPRVMGPVMAFNLADERGDYKSREGEFLRDWYLSHGLNIRPLGNAVYIMPPYCISDAQLDRAYEGIFEGLHQRAKTFA
ncbi:MAG: adenosylmethionine--8-amino-7-oxononanoate transaminase [Rhodospirillales bacterium]|nr:adenosylmethionine--8-amino-7-oxononanoate transaminase [Alphaproteobacteria bacterium]USO03178.1 MAG: adenosylmethionine--8-amino-7-oxononanoate transaminase [Rhodospirillales bacterium]